MASEAGAEQGVVAGIEQAHPAATGGLSLLPLPAAPCILPVSKKDGGNAISGFLREAIDATYAQCQEERAEDRGAQTAKSRREKRHQDADQEVHGPREERIARSGAKRVQDRGQEARQGGGEARDPPEPGGPQEVAT